MRWHYRHSVLLLTMGAFFGAMGSRLLISPLVPQVIDAYGISKAAIGIALTGMWASYGLLQFPGGILSDRFGERRIVLLGLLTVIAGTLVAATAPMFPLFVAATMLIGAGNGLYFPSAVSLLTRLFDDTGLALSFHIGGGNMSGLVTPLIAAYIGIQFGWRAAVLVGSLIVFAFFIAGSQRIRPTNPRNAEISVREEVNLRRVLALLSRPSIAYTTVVAILLGAVFQSILSFFPTFLIEFHGLSTVRASTIFSLIFVVIVVVLPLMGRISDSFVPDTALALSSILLLAGVGTLLFRMDGTVLVGAILIGAGSTWGGVIGARYMEHLAKSEQGTGYGLVRAVYVVIASSANTLVGGIADIAGWAIAFLLLAAVLALTLALLAANQILDLKL